MSKQKNLTPPDKLRCQVMKYHPFILGGDVYTQCLNKPSHIIHETVPGDDGMMGSQSVCEDCRKSWEEKTGIPGVNPTWRWEKLEGKDNG